MNRPIKFRGRRSDNGELVYGNGIYQDLPVTEKQKELGFVSRTYIIGTEFPLVAKLWHPVDPDTVAQLVGFDADGNEVYEGDKILIDDAGEDEFFATCLPVGVNHWGGCFLHGGNFIFTKEFSLKEACQNPWNALQEIDNLIERHVEEAKQ